MTYLVKHNHNSGRTGKIIAILVLTATVFIVIHLSSPHFFGAVGAAIARPFWRIEFSMKNGSLDSPEALMAENQRLKREIAENSVRLQSIGALETENTELRSLYGRNSAMGSSTESVKGVLAAVLRRPPLSAYDELIIDIGRDFGISTSSRIYAPGNVEIGRVIEVFARTSKVLLFSSPGEKYEVLIGRAHAPATAIGRGGGQYQAELPRDVEVSEGDFVLAPSISNTPFGIVSSILADPAKAFRTILFAPPVNVYELRWVIVEK